ncbi:hypothetical protein OS493_038020 [Desmophyllum pertusum]|uniref:1-aminocyclopropane-1-carboxylate deaminase n=1 Tax=Desmophyllum pertusum TaxID=174260 RepID=A0A9W9ZVS2_9CNID|nr:hypothetical protein OS493_038020 [Desmophyllum pertusum]
MDVNNSPLHQYEPPNWASSLKNIPQHFVKLAQRNTPIHPWNIPNLPKEFSLSVKRDDLTGCALSGNKTTDIGRKGNLLLSRIVGSRVILVPHLQCVSDLKPMMKKMVEELHVWLPDGISRNDESENILEITSTTGVLVDPVYNIKAIRGMLAEMNHNPGRFKGRRILYIHTGGLFGLFDGRIDPLITSSQSAKCENEVFCWRDINEPPPC